MPADAATGTVRVDLRRAVALATFGCAALTLVDYVATLVAYPSSIPVVAALRLLVLDIALVLLLWPLAFAALAAAMLAARGVQHLRRRAYAGLFVADTASAPSRLVPWLWGGLLGAALHVGAATGLAIWLVPRFKELQLTALVLALLQLGVVAVAAAAAIGTALGLRALARRLEPRLGRANPLNRLAPALGLAALLFVIAVEIAIHLMPQLGPQVPWRNLLAVAGFAAGVWAGTAFLARRPLLPQARHRRRIAIAAVAVGVVAVVPLALLRVGADPETKGMIIAASPTMSRLVDLVRRSNDFDGDGFGSLLGENDCAPFQAKVHPGARDLPDNGIDENCDGRDFSLSALPAYVKGERMPVPTEFQRPWNVLLITIDTVRYDHTSFGGYLDKSGRDTTPNLAKLVERSSSFDSTVAPSAGTMASVPAILTSKFFHSGIALDENVKRGAPPRLTKENTLISEIMKRGGYATGAILTHEYFNDWGMEQGFDSYDNALGKKPDAYRVSADKLTDRALAWVTKRAGNDKPWFLWTHYIDPHGRYVAHPGDTSYGTSEEDLYDGELSFTDKQLGRLFDELARLPGADRTIIVITSDHGDGFNEHGFINHGMALYRELLHVPMIIHVPDLEPQRFGGVTSNLDLVPTIADLAGIDVSDLSFEGESLVPQLFYGRENPDRVVFSETNYPKPLRAAVTNQYKLIFHLTNNLYELYDLAKDPWEKTNLASRDPSALATMKRYLDDWLERVYYARDPVTNQAAAKLADVLLAAAPTPAQPIAGASVDDGHVEVLGWDTEVPAGYAPGEKASLGVYFHTVAKPSGSFKLQVEIWPRPAGTAFDPHAPRGNARVARSSARAPADGMFPTERWRPGEFVRDLLKVKLPADWAAGEVVVGLRVTRNSDAGTDASPGAGGAILDAGATLVPGAKPAAGKRAAAGADVPVPFVGPSPADQPGLLVLGTMQLLPPMTPPGAVPAPPGAAPGPRAGAAASPLGTGAARPAKPAKPKTILPAPRSTPPRKESAPDAVQ